MPLFAGLSLRRWRTSDQGSLPPPSYESQPPSYRQTYTGLSEATNSRNEPRPSLSNCKGPVELPTRRPRRPKVFVYYKVFTPDGAISCKEPVNPRDPYLGRIEAVHIAPPQTVASLMRCILKNEGRIHSSDLELKLFEASSSLAPMEPEKHLSTVIGIDLGADPRKPLALVVAVGLDNATCASDLQKPLPLVVRDVFDTAIIATMNCTYGKKDSRWLSFECGDVLHINGILHKDVACIFSTAKLDFDAYLARDKSGHVGYVPVTFVRRLRS